MKKNDLTNLHGLSRALNLPYDWLKGEADAARLPCLRVGRRRLFNIETVRQALAQRAAYWKAQAKP